MIILYQVENNICSHQTPSNVLTPTMNRLSNTTTTRDRVTLPGDYGCHPTSCSVITTTGSVITTTGSVVSSTVVAGSGSYPQYNLDRQIELAEEKQEGPLSLPYRYQAYQHQVCTIEVVNMLFS